MDFERFRLKVRINKKTQCWEWQGALKAKPGLPYGFFSHNGKNRLAHRVSYEWWVGNISSELEINHKCNNPSCCNPEHLEQVTRHENLMKSNGITAKNARKTHCPQGHPLSGDNLQINNQGRRTCRTCNIRRSREWKIRTGYH